MNPSTGKLVNLWDAAIRIIMEPGEESKTEAEHVNLIRGQYNQLLNNLTSASEMAGRMYQDGKITAKELEHIQQFHSTPIRASEELLNIIMKSSPDVYECFLRLLKDTKQHHVYQMLTTASEQSDLCYSGHESVSEHCRLIQRNYAWLTEKLNPDHSLLAVLLGKEVMSGRDYEQISSWENPFKKNEMLLSLISRKSSVDFKHFQDALNETLQSHINQKLTGAATDAECKHKLKAVDKTKMDSCQRSVGKRIRPKIPPKPVIQLQLTVTPAQPEHFLVQRAQPTLPSRFKLVAENHHTSTQHNVNMRQLFNVESQFKRLQNEVQFEMSTKIAVLRKKGTNDNIWKILVEKILHESRQNRESQSRNKAMEEKCDRLRQEILQEKNNFFTFQHEMQRETTNTGKQIRVLQEDRCHLEASLKSAGNDNEKLNKRLEESQIVVDNLKTLNQETERKAAERDRIHSMQLNELKEKLRVCESEIYKLYQIEKELNNEVRKYKEMVEKHHQENYELKKRNEALSTELDLNKRSLKELEGETSFYKQGKTESKLSETEKKSKKTETSFKLSLTETEEMLKATETELKETEARPTVAQAPFVETEAVVTAEVGLQDKLNSYPLLAHEAKRIATINTKKLIRGLALLDKKLFVVSEQSSEIEVYNSMKFSHKWKLNELVRPLDIVSCIINECLYILHTVDDYLTTEILRVAPNEKLIIRWSTGKMSEGNLSVSYKANVILTAYFERKLKEFSPDGKQIRDINLSSDAGIIHPLHAIRMTNGHFVVSHGGKVNKRNLVCVVDVDGKLKKSVGTGRGLTIELTSCPVYLGIDRNGFVMVADQTNSRVLLLGSDLELKGEILSKEKHGFQKPYKILLDKSNYQLFVVNNQRDEGRILVFELR